MPGRYGALGDRRPPALEPDVGNIRLPSFEVNVASLGPKAGLQNHSETRGNEEDAARPGNGRGDDTNGDQQDADDENRPLDHRVIDEPPPLSLRNHRKDVVRPLNGCKDLQFEAPSRQQERTELGGARVAYRVLWSPAQTGTQH